MNKILRSIVDTFAAMGTAQAGLSAPTRNPGYDMAEFGEDLAVRIINHERLFVESEPSNGEWGLYELQRAEHLLDIVRQARKHTVLDYALKGLEVLSLNARPVIPTSDYPYVSKGGIPRGFTQMLQKEPGIPETFKTEVTLLAMQQVARHMQISLPENGMG